MMNREELLTKQITANCKINPKTQADVRRAARYLQAVDLAIATFNDRAFREDLLRATFNGKPGFASTSDTPEQVLQKIINGSELLSKEVDYEWDWGVEFYHKDDSVVGYTNPGTRKIFVNTKFFDSYTLEDIARNIIHEMTHKLGYDHDFNRTTKRPESVPYEIGELMEVHAKARLRGTPIPNVIITKAGTKVKRRVWWKPWTW